MGLFDKIHPSWQFYSAVFGVICGIFAEVVFEINIFDFLGLKSWFGLGVATIIGVIVLVFAIFFASKWTLVLAIVTGILLGQVRASVTSIELGVWRDFIGQEVTISGKIIVDPSMKETGQGIKLGDIKFSTDRDEAVENYQLPGTLYAQIVDTRIDLWQGDSLVLRGKIADGFGTYAASMYRPEITSWERGEQNLIIDIKRVFVQNVKNALDESKSGLGLGYLVGDKTSLDDALQEKLRTVGMTHVIVASGTHLGIIVGMARKLFGRISKFAEVWGASLMVLLFVTVVGFTASMTRASLVTILSLLVGYVGRKFSPVRLVGFVAMITLLISPMNFIDLGWQLSFASFVGILIIAPTITKFLYGGKSPPWLASMFLTSLATIATCFPILVYNFGTISLLSFAANLVILPTLPYVMLLILMVGLFVPITGLIFDVVNWVCIKLVNILLDVHLLVVNFLSEQTIFVLKFKHYNPNIFWWYAIFGIILGSGYLLTKTPLCAKVKKYISSASE